jgi:SAM-dependent methyltransferase
MRSRPCTATPVPSDQPTDQAARSSWVHDAGYFESLYAEDPDPWGFDDRWYERRKHALTVALLPEPRHRRGVEAGCANGALTELLATRCDELIAFDPVPDVAARAATRLADQPHVEVLVGRLPELWPDGTGDLVVWSEVAYYLGREAADAAADGLRRWLEPGGALVAVHWTDPTDYPRTGEEVDRWLDGLPFLSRRTTLVEPQFRAGVWLRDPDDRTGGAGTRLAGGGGVR